MNRMPRDAEQRPDASRLTRLERMLLRLRYPFFDPAFYKRCYPDIAAQNDIHPRGHYHKFGRREGRRANRLGISGPRSLMRRVRLWMRYPRFDSHFYLQSNPDVAIAGLEPLEHYDRHGRFEGRDPAPGHVDPSVPVAGAAEPNVVQHGRWDSLQSDRQTLLIVLHEASRTGAPIIGYTLVAGLSEHYNIVVLSLEDGPVAKACKNHGAVVIASRNRCRDEVQAARIITEILQETALCAALVNSIEARFALPALTARQVPCINLIHEFASCIRPRQAFLDAILSADQSVFPAEIVRKNAQECFPMLTDTTFPLIPQCLGFPLPGEGVPETQDRVDARLGLDDLPDGTAVVLAVGFFSYRKGPDLFVQVAARVARVRPDLKIHFVWVGGGFSPETDGLHSAFLEDQIAREGLGSRIILPGEFVNMDAVYARADVMLLPSRLDPLPCVSMEAMAAGLPVICFDRTTGFADIMRDLEVEAYCLADYLDVEDMAERLILLLDNPDKLREIGQAGSALVAREFGRSTYFDRIRAEIEQVTTTRSEAVPTTPSAAHSP